MQEILSTITRLVDAEVLAATESSIMAREATTIEGMIGGLLLTEARLEAALAMIRGARALADRGVA